PTIAGAGVLAFVLMKRTRRGGYYVSHPARSICRPACPARARPDWCAVPAAAERRTAAVAIRARGSDDLRRPSCHPAGADHLPRAGRGVPPARPGLQPLERSPRNPRRQTDPASAWYRPRRRANRIPDRDGADLAAPAQLRTV